MNRRTKIIVSVAGIFIVLLALLGLTYGYFLTRINGNSNEKSIKISTAKDSLSLRFDDGDNSILGEGMEIYPSSEPIGTKTFSVINENQGKDSKYVLFLENISIKDSEGQPTIFDSNDFRYTLTCTSSDETQCNGISEQEVLPINGGILLTLDIKKASTQTFTLTVWYIDTGIDQSSDKGKTLEAKINIKLIDTKSLFDSILYKYLVDGSSNNTKYTTMPLTTPGESRPNSSEKSLVPIQDDYGTSYYFRGNVEDNYVNFSGMCWRIVRIEGDGSIKLILEDVKHGCQSENFDGNWAAYANSKSLKEPESITDAESYKNSNMATVLKNFQSNLNINYLKQENWCIDTSTNLINGLKCSGTTINEFSDSTAMYVGALTLNEVKVAGAQPIATDYDASVNISNYYMINDWTFSGDTAHDFYTFTLNTWRNQSFYHISRRGHYEEYQSATNPYYRPVITIKANTNFLYGDGTKKSAYNLN